MFSTNTHQDMHDWGWNMKRRRRKMFKKKQKVKGTCPQCVITPTMHFQGSTAICSNWSPYCTQLRPLVAGLLFFETLKASSLALKVIRSRTRPQMPPFWSCLQLCLVVYALQSRHSFCPTPSPVLLRAWPQSIGLLLFLSRLLCWGTRPLQFNQLHDFPIISR